MGKAMKYELDVTMDNGSVVRIVSEAIVSANRVVVLSVRGFDDREESPLGRVESGSDGTLSRTEEGIWTKSERLRLINGIRCVNASLIGGHNAKLPV